MLEKLGVKKFVYDYRAERIPQWDDELSALKKHGVELFGWWFPTSLNDEAEKTLELFKHHGVKPQLWVNGNGGPDGGEGRSGSSGACRERGRASEAHLRSGGSAGLQVALYNHGAWYGEPEERRSPRAGSCKAQGIKNIGIVYNLHHGHGHLDRLDRSAVADDAPSALPQPEWHGHRGRCEGAKDPALWVSARRM